MNREEAKNQFSNELLERAMGFKKGKLKIGAVYKIIDDIYDDFESRTCKNCKYFIKDKFVCCNSKAPTIVQINDDSFGCSKFERRES